jgi:hypothetical protein
MSTYSKSLVKSTIRFTLSDEVSKLVGGGTPYMMTPLEDKISKLKGVSKVKVVRWGVPFEVDVTIDKESAAEFDLTMEDVEDIVDHHITRHYDEYKGVEKFGKVDGAYLPDQTLVVCGREFIVLKHQATGEFTLKYESDDGEVVSVELDPRDALAETTNELIEEVAGVPGSAARGTLHFEDWISRHKRGIVLPVI